MTFFKSFQLAYILHSISFLNCRLIYLRLIMKIAKSLKNMILKADNHENRKMFRHLILIIQLS